jgi:hypothetical protein
MGGGKPGENSIGGLILPFSIESTQPHEHKGEGEEEAWATPAPPVFKRHQVGVQGGGREEGHARM